MKHILDQKILKKWGFVWAQKEKDTAIAYITETKQSDMFLGDPISLVMFPDPNTGVKWYLTVLGNGKQTKDRILFAGQIPSWKDLDCILKCTLIFKPK